MIILSGGTGTPKLLDGLKEILPPEELTVVVNTAEDLWVSGNLISPDLDTVLYLFSDQIDRKKWWGIENDTFRTYERMQELGVEESLRLGDRDRATHIIRSNLIRDGASLTEATVKLASLLGIDASILPMSDDPVSTCIETLNGVMHFQDFWVGKHGEPDVLGVDIRGVSEASVAKKVLEALETDDRVLIGPSNPITSIGPIISLPGMRELLKKKKVVAVSPIIGNAPVSGPAGKLMQACGLEVSSMGVAEYYQEFLDVFVFDERDRADEFAFERLGCRACRADTLMTSTEKSRELAEFVVGLFDTVF
ncbi:MULTISPECIES: 2-phospho-L-lactate transferase [unclassified Methanosarcina]|jgi:LPPG:FO 2-phospho-L-lactate transferase|uniref:2-phospho-L-lactate transferase n=1 Tax=unclassified Methanosarcina TaxID=2644672 RepID=UPI0006218262|nr:MULTISPECIES: 2-phospho-L-lactate transferase [unclassified Methanosarcina]KKG11899.1 LPPG:FO 2-phospho-L-lactate transferase [Methanosarcina sp. 2.H.A.1B.4]KKH48151.1 LPPG:FO 2-phospho-L-lactate transferase [Methanosarcina sp. 1.H.A.2.2]